METAPLRRPLAARRRAATRRGAGGNRRVPFVPLMLGLLLASVLSAVVSLAFGSERIPVGEVVATVGDRLQGNAPGRWDVIVWELRVPRALMSVVVGAGLAVAGAGMQTLVRNPLAVPGHEVGSRSLTWREPPGEVWIV